MATFELVKDVRSMYVFNERGELPVHEGARGSGGAGFVDLDAGWPGRKSLVSGWDPRLLIHRGALGEESGSIDLGLLICEMGILPANEGCLARGNNAFGRLSEESGASQVFRIMSHFHTAFIAFFKGKGYVGKFCEKGNIYTCRSALRACRCHPRCPARQTQLQAPRRPPPLHCPCDLNTRRRRGLKECSRGPWGPKVGDLGVDLNSRVCRRATVVGSGERRRLAPHRGRGRV